MATAECRLRDHLVPMRGYKLSMRQLDEATEILCDFYSATARSDFKVWTNETGRVRIDMGGGYLGVGSSYDTAADLGAFTAGESRSGTVEVTVPASSGSRHEALTLFIDLGV